MTTSLITKFADRITEAASPYTTNGKQSASPIPSPSPLPSPYLSTPQQPPGQFSSHPPSPHHYSSQTLSQPSSPYPSTSPGFSHPNVLTFTFPEAKRCDLTATGYQDPIFSVCPQKKTISIRRGGSGLPIAEATSHSLSSSIDLTFAPHGLTGPDQQPINLKGNMLEDWTITPDLISPMKGGGELKWKVDKLMGRYKELIDSRGTSLAKMSYKGRQASIEFYVKFSERRAFELAACTAILLRWRYMVSNYGSMSGGSGCSSTAEGIHTGVEIVNALSAIGGGGA